MIILWHMWYCLPTVSALIREKELILQDDVPVNVLVVAEMVLSPEGLAADVTAVGPLVSMGSLVNEEVVGFRELPVTELANKLLSRPAGPGQRGLQHSNKQHISVNIV